MARTSVDLVELIIDTDLTEPEIEAFIDDASVWIDSHLDGECGGLSDSALAVIEKYLAAHLITARDPRLKSKTRGDVSDSYQRDGSMSEYLKMAIALDPCGIIKDSFQPSPNQRSARFRVGAGYDPSLTELGVDQSE